MATYSVTYFGNNNDTGTVPSDVNTYMSGDTATVLGNLNGLDSTGYSFDGWCTSRPNLGYTCSTVSGTRYIANDTLTVTSNVNLYAIWKSSIANITYDGNSNTSGSVPVDSSNYTPVTTALVLGNSGNLANTSYNFSGWCLTRPAVGNACAGTTYLLNDSVTVDGNITLYAIWIPVTTYTVTYDGNTNIGGSVPNDSSSPYTSGSLVTVIDNTGSLTKSSYTFDGWCTTQPAAGSTCGGVKYLAAATFTISGNVTLYAIWKSNGGGGGAPVYVPHPPTITNISAPEVCALDGQLTISGTYLSGATVTVDGEKAKVLSFSYSEITVKLPDASVGTKEIKVTNADGSATTTVKYSFADTPVYVNFIYPETYKDRAFSYTFTATDAAKYAISGVLPAGLTLNPLTGEISGTPTQTGNYEFTIIASNICDSAPLLVYMFVDKPFPNAYTCSVAFNVPASNNISDAKLAQLKNCLSRIPDLSPKYIDPVIFLSGGIPAGLTSDQALTHPRYLPIIDLINSMNLDAQIYYGAFNGSTDSVQLNIYWPEPSL